MRVRFSSRSILHLCHIRSFIARGSVDVAEEVRRRILATIERLCLLPRLGREGRHSGTREMVVPGLPYIIVYRIDIGDADELVILGVFHGAENRRS
jgi:plasmid stabilization system protein ParE